MFLARFSFRVFPNIEKVNEEIRLIYIFMPSIPDSRLLLIVPDSLLLLGGSRPGINRFLFASYSVVIRLLFAP